MAFFLKQRWRATIFMVLAALTLNISLAFLRWFRKDVEGLADHDVTALISLGKYAVITLVSGVWILINKQKIFWKGFGTLAIFGMADPLATMSLLIGGLTVPLALNSILGDLHILITPVILFLFSRNTQVPRHHLFLTGLGFLGVLAFAWPQIQLYGGVPNQMFLPVLAALLWCACGLLSAQISAKPLAVVQFITAASGLFLSLTLIWKNLSMEVVHTVFSSTNFIYSLILSILAQLFFISSMASGDILAALIAAPAYAIFGGLVGYAFFNEGFGVYEWGGFILVIVSVVFFHLKPNIRRSYQ